MERYDADSAVAKPKAIGIGIGIGIDMATNPFWK